MAEIQDFDNKNESSIEHMGERLIRYIKIWKKSGITSEYWLKEVIGLRKNIIDSIDTNAELGEMKKKVTDLENELRRFGN